MDIDSVIYTRTAKGIMAVKNGDRDIKNFSSALGIIDGRSTFGELSRDLIPEARARLQNDLNRLQELGYVRVFIASSPAAIAANEAHQHDAIEFDGQLRSAVEVVEHGQEEGVRVWAEACRRASELKEKGYFATGVERGPQPRPAAGLSVLVVEDTEAVAQLISTYLTRRGFKTTVIGDGQDAIDYLEQHPRPDLALLDVNLPRLSGFEILEYIRTEPKFSDLPAIMVTARVTEADVLRGLKGGADGYIFKPFEWTTLYGCVKSVLRLAD